MTELNTSAALSSEHMANVDSDESGWETSGLIYRSPSANKVSGAPATLFAGDVILGTFIKAEPNKYKGFNYLVRTAQGTEVVNGCGSLSKAFESSQPNVGDTLRITYEGKKMLTTGEYKGTEAHQYKLAVKRQAK